VDVGHGGKTVAEPAAVVGAPGLACCIPASRVAISAGEGVGNSVSGEAKTGEVKVVEVLPPVPDSLVAQGAGVGDAGSENGGVGVTETGGGIEAGAQPVMIARQAHIATSVADLNRIMLLPKRMLQLGCCTASPYILHDLNPGPASDFADEVRVDSIYLSLCHIRSGLCWIEGDQQAT